MLAIQALINLYPGNCFQMPRKYIDFGYFKSIIQNMQRIKYLEIQHFREICCRFPTVGHSFFRIPAESGYAPTSPELKRGHAV